MNLCERMNKKINLMCLCDSVSMNICVNNSRNVSMSIGMCV